MSGRPNKALCFSSNANPEGFVNPATAPVMDWESDVGGVLMILLDPGEGATADDTEDEDEEVDGASFREAPDGERTEGGAGTEAEAMS